MKIIVNSLDISQMVERITWSGDTKQVARKLKFSIASKGTDYYLPKPVLGEGDTVVMMDSNNSILFTGIIFEITKSAAGNTTSYLAFDLLFYVNTSDINKIFDATPEVIAANVCAELDIPFGGAAETGINVYMPCLNKSGYTAIMMAYTYASRQNGKKYIPIMRDNKLWVVEKGAFCGVVLSGDTNLFDASYKVTLQNHVNKVVIVDKSGKITDTVADTASVARYGTIQRICTAEDGRDAKIAATALLHGKEYEAKTTSISDVRAISGYAIAVREEITGLYGKFFIESDMHTIENGNATMELSLSFDNIMDEIDMEAKQEG